MYSPVCRSGEEALYLPVSPSHLASLSPKTDCTDWGILDVFNGMCWEENHYNPFYHPLNRRPYPSKQSSLNGVTWVKPPLYVTSRWCHAPKYHLST